MRTKLEEKLIRMSYNLIPLHNESKFKHYSFLVRRNNILGIYLNNPTKTHSLSKRFKFKWQTLHSEIALLASTSFVFGKEFPRLKVYNVRINNLGQISIAKPCINCDLALKSFGFRDVYYTNNDGFFHHWDDPI